MMRDGSKWAIGGWLVGGAAWVTTGLAGLDAVNGTGGFYVTDVAWLVVHALVLIGLVGLVRSCPPGETLSRRGFTVAIVGRVVFLAAEGVAIAVADDEIALFPLAAVLTAGGDDRRRHRRRDVARAMVGGLTPYPSRTGNRWLQEASCPTVN